MTMLAPGEILQGRYVIDHLIGQGGAGSVYVAYDNRLCRKCAIKEALRSTDPTLQKALKREALLLANLHHRALPSIIDHFQELATWYVVMQLIPGDDLAAQLKRNNRPFAPGKVLSWAGELLDALTHIHEAGIVHGDIKPANLKISPSGQIVLLDFGFARGSLTEVLDLPSSVIGHTPTYASPEQLNGEEPDSRDDLYSLAATLYHLLLYDRLKTPPPFAVMVRNAALVDGKDDPLRSAHELNPEVSPEFATVLAEAMARRRSQRPKSASVMGAALRKASETQGSPSNQVVSLDVNVSLDATELYYQFETVTINQSGKITERRNDEARYFIEDLGRGVTVEMVSIARGTFLMGSPEWRPEMADGSAPIGCIGPQHEVTVPPFYLSKYQVTQVQWRAIAIMKAISCDLPLRPSKFPFGSMNFKGNEFEGKEFNELPVEGVQWRHAVEFCRRLSSFARRDYRLPSESEWEYACRAGTTTPFALGETLTPEVANFEGQLFDRRLVSNQTYGSTIPVGALGVANSFGLYDMPGNVWEWCADTNHRTYNGAPSDGSAWVQGDRRLHVIRGGCWDSSLKQCASAYHFSELAASQSRGIGLRIAMTIPA